MIKSFIQPTPGIFKRIERKNPGGSATRKPEKVDEELSVQEQEDDQTNTSSASGYYSCPLDGRVRVFRRLSAFEKHLALEKCEQKLERLSLFDHSKLDYKQYLEEGTGIIPALNPTVTATSSANPTVSEGWALKANKLELNTEKEECMSYTAPENAQLPGVVYDIHPDFQGI